MRAPYVGQTLTFAHGTRTGANTFAEGETAKVTRADGHYVTAETADGRKIQTWSATFSEFVRKARAR